MSTAGIPAHTLLPLALLLTAAAALTASLAFRLARTAQRRAGWLAVGAPLVPALRPHLAHDGADLAAVVLASVLLFLAVIQAQRTRIAQLPLLWGWHLDHGGRRALIRHGGAESTETARRVRRRGVIRRWHPPKR